MKGFLHILLLGFTFLSTECFIASYFPKRLSNRLACPASKYNFTHLATNSISEKYLFIESLIQHLVLHKNDLLLNYCSKKFNQTDIMHITISCDLEYIVQKHYHSKSTLELYNLIQNNSKLTDCYMCIYTLKDLKQ